MCQERGGFFISIQLSGKITTFSVRNKENNWFSTRKLFWHLWDQKLRSRTTRKEISRKVTLDDLEKNRQSWSSEYLMRLFPCFLSSRMNNQRKRPSWEESNNEINDHLFHRKLIYVLSFTRCYYLITSTAITWWAIIVIFHSTGFSVKCLYKMQEVLVFFMLTFYCKPTVGKKLLLAKWFFKRDKVLLQVNLLSILENKLTKADVLSPHFPWGTDLTRNWFL